MCASLELFFFGGRHSGDGKNSGSMVVTLIVVWCLPGYTLQFFTGKVWHKATHIHVDRATVV